MCEVITIHIGICEGVYKLHVVPPEPRCLSGNEVTKCDVCGQPVDDDQIFGNGQVTADCILCAECIHKAQGK